MSTVSYKGYQGNFWSPQANRCHNYYSTLDFPKVTGLAWSKNFYLSTDYTKNRTSWIWRIDDHLKTQAMTGGKGYPLCLSSWYIIFYMS